MGTARNTVVRIGVAAATATTLAACGVEGDLETGRARPDGRAIAVAAAAGRVTPPERWPNACSLLTEDELRAVLPSAKDIEIDPADTTPFFAHGTPGGAEATRRRVPHGRCAYSMELPGPSQKFSSTRRGTGSFSIDLDAVGDPDLVARLYAAGKAARAEGHRLEDVGVGGADCHLYSPTKRGPSIRYLACRKGPVMFTVERASFDGIAFEGVTHRDNDFNTAVDERILVPVAETAAADLPAP